jgi:hypothetical protein
MSEQHVDRARGEGLPDLPADELNPADARPRRLGKMRKERVWRSA